MTQIVLAHGGGGPIETLVGVAPVVIGALMLTVVTLLLLVERNRVPDVNEGVRDTTPSPGRQIFDGDYDWRNLMLVAEVESAFKDETEERERNPDVARA